MGTEVSKTTEPLKARARPEPFWNIVSLALPPITYGIVYLMFASGSGDCYSRMGAAVLLVICAGDS